MNFNSLQFLIFLPVVVFLYWIVPHKFRWVILLIASYYFYMSWNPWLVFLILGTTIVSYGAALLMDMTDKKGLKKLYMALTLIICLGVLIFFKYFNFLLSSVIDFLNLFKMDLDPIRLNLILPVGISFYTFQTLSYVIDVYRGNFKAEKHFGYYALFVSYFPQLVAGPIERPEDLIPQLREPHKFNKEDFIAGIQFLLIGFFRKCVIADFVATYVDKVFANLSASSGLAIIVASALFLVQIYCDFAGYSEIALGSARLMGVRLTRNFDRPLLSINYTEYFRRWHITLNKWFTDYVYIPLGGSRKGLARKILNVLIVFSLCGLWHGASWTYFLWGLWAGVFVSIESLLRKPFKNLCEKTHLDTNSFGYKAVRVILMWVTYVPACVLFRASSINDIGTAFSRMFTSIGDFNSIFSDTGLTGATLVALIVMIVALELLYYFDPENQEKFHLNHNTKKNFSFNDMAVIFFIIIAIAASWLTLISNSDTSAFAYFQF